MTEIVLLKKLRSATEKMMQQDQDVLLKEVKYMEKVLPAASEAKYRAPLWILNIISQSNYYFKKILPTI